MRLKLTRLDSIPDRTAFALYLLGRHWRRYNRRVPSFFAINVKPVVEGAVPCNILNSECTKLRSTRRNVPIEPFLLVLEPCEVLDSYLL